MCSLREKLFVTGLSAANHPGSTTENYLLTDNDMRLFGENAPMSETKPTGEKLSMTICCVQSVY